MWWAYTRGGAYIRGAYSRRFTVFRVFVIFLCENSRVGALETTGCPQKNLRYLISCNVKTIKAITLN
jgi:hypothetical protein